jgi:O-antigen ligase
MGSFILAALAIFHSKKNIRTAAIILSVGVLIMAIVALTRHARNNFSFAMVNESVAPFFRNHVNYSSMLICVVPVLLAFYKGAKQKQLRFWLGIALAVLLLAIFFSYARGAWLALGMGFLAVWLIKKRLLLIAYIAAIIISLSTAFWLQSNERYLRYAHDFNTTIFHENFGQHLVATYKLKDVSTAERFYRWVAAVRMVKDSWLHGFGPGSFYEQYKSYTIPAYKTWVSDNKEHSTVHNYFLLLLIEQGAPGLFFFLLLLGAMLYYAQKLYHRVEDSFYRTVVVTAGAIIVMIATVNFLSDLIETDKIGSLFFLCLSLFVMCDINSRKGPQTATKPE